MKVALSLLIVGVLLAAIGVGIWVDATTPKLPKYNPQTVGERAAFGAALTVIGGSMAVVGGVQYVITVKRGDKPK
jgi:hypothetical protein